MPPDAETALTVVTNKRHCTVPTVQSRKRTDTGNRVFVVYRGGVRIRCSEIHTSGLAKEIQLKRSSRAECEWNMKDWQAAMDEIEKRGCWGIRRRNKNSMVRLSGVGIGCSKIHKSELEKEVKLKRSSRAECEWTMKDWQATMDQIKNRGCWGVKYHKGKDSVRLGGVGIGCSQILKAELAMEMQFKRSSRAECEWTMEDWRAAVDQIKNRECWGVKYRSGNFSDKVSVTCGGVRIGCSKIHKSELAKEIQLKRSSRAECEWTLKDWQAAMNQIKNRGCWGLLIKYRKGKDSVHLGGAVIGCSQIHKAECKGTDRASVTLGGVRIRCSKIHKSELEKEIKLKRSSRVECEWSMKDWQVAMDQIKDSGCWGMKLKYHHNGN
jgi:soluble cytochrome b562